MTVKITIDDSKLIAASPYHPDLPKKAKNMGGKWNPSLGTWVFDARAEKRVRDLYIEVYGTDGTLATGDLITLRVETPDYAEMSEIWSAHHSGLYLAGRCVARATGRDSGAKLGEGVIVIEGGFTSGGSVKNWRTKAIDTKTIFEIRDVPRAKALEAIEELKGNRLIEKIEIIDTGVDKETLIAERAALMARVAAIDALLAE